MTRTTRRCSCYEPGQLFLIIEYIPPEPCSVVQWDSGVNPTPRRSPLRAWTLIFGACTLISLILAKGNGPIPAHSRGKIESWDYAESRGAVNSPFWTLIAVGVREGNGARPEEILFFP